MNGSRPYSWKEVYRAGTVRVVHCHDRPGPFAFVATDDRSVVEGKAGTMLAALLKLAARERREMPGDRMLRRRPA